MALNMFLIPPPAPPPPLSPSPSPSPSPTPFPRVPLRARETRFAGYEDDVKMEQLTSHTRAGRHKCQHYFRYSRAFFCLLELVLLFCRRYHRRPRSCLAKTPQCLTWNATREDRALLLLLLLLLLFAGILKTTTPNTFNRGSCCMLLSEGWLNLMAKRSLHSKIPGTYRTSTKLGSPRGGHLRLEPWHSTLYNLVAFSW